MRPEDALTEAYLRSHPLEAARQLESLPPEDAAALILPLDARVLAGTLEHVLPAHGAAVLVHLPRESAAKVIASLPSSIGIAVLRQCLPTFQAELLADLDTSIGPTLRRALAYPAHTAGSLADPRVLTLPADITVAEALHRVQQNHLHATYYLYVLDRGTRLVGVVSIKQLLAADQRDRVGSVMTTPVVSLSAGASAEELLKHPQWRLYHTMPIVDRAGTFQGALRYRTLRAMEEDALPVQASGTVSEALIALWEAYAVIGILVMTNLAGALTQPPTPEPETEKEGSSHELSL